MSPNEKNKLKLRQIAFIFLAFMPVTKISLLPSVTAGYAEEQLWLASLISFAADICVLCIALLLCRKHGNSTLFNILEKRLGKFSARTIYFLYGIYFMLKASLPLIEQQDYVQNTLYEITPSALIFMPLFIVSFYQSLKGLKILGRCADVFIFFTAAGVALTFLLSVPAADFTNILPIIQKLSYKPVIASFKTVTWYSDSVYMLLFMGHFKVEKHQAKKLIGSYAAAALTVIFFMIVFYSSFASIAKTRYFATPEMTIYSLSIANAARFDYIAIFLLMFPQVFAIILPIYLATKCFERAFGLKTSIVPAIAVNLLLTVFIVIFQGKLFSVLSVMTDVLSYVFLFFGYVVPVLLLFIPEVKTYEIAR